MNLYAGIGGNRKLWEGVEVTAIEINPKIAMIYQKHFPQDKVIVADAHQFLLEHFEEFDFIWSSPPCPSHSVIRKIQKNGKGDSQNKPIYPDMKLYEEILLLEGYFKGKWCVENVIPWYEPLIPGKRVQRHLFWSNFVISKANFEADNIRDANAKELCENLGFEGNIDKTLLRNCVKPELGLHIFKCAFKDKQRTLGCLVKPPSIYLAPKEAGILKDSL